MPINCPETLRDPFYKTQCFGCHRNREGFCTFYCPPWSARVPITSILTTSEQLAEYESRIACLESVLSKIEPGQLVRFEFGRQMSDMRKDIGRMYRLIEHRPAPEAVKVKTKKTIKTTDL